MNAPSHPFETLTIPRKGGIPQSVNRYRVYKDAKDFTIFDAESALEALQKSGLQQAYRIERESIFLNNIVDLKEIEKNAPPAPPPAKPPEAIEAAPKPPEENKVPAAAEPPKEALSSEDVDKLLQEKSTGS